MALIKCKDCSKEFSTDAKTCPNCGANRKKTSRLSSLMTILLMIILIGIFAAPKEPNLDQSGISTSSLILENNKVKYPTKENGKWEKYLQKSPMDDSQTIILKLPANNSIKTWLQTTYPELHIMCHENKTHIYVNTGAAANPELGSYQEYTVRLRIDNSKPFEQKWSQSTDNQALFAPNPIILAKQLKSAQVLRFEFIPFNSNPAIIEFSLHGLSSLLTDVAKTCQWNIN